MIVVAIFGAAFFFGSQTRTTNARRGQSTRKVRGEARERCGARFSSLISAPSALSAVSKL
jgi:hypothetical protein